MAFPSDNVESLADAWLEAQRRAGVIKRQAQSYITDLAAANTSANVALQISEKLAVAKADFTRWKNMPGLPEYAQAQQNNPGLDIATEFQGMVGAIDGVISWIVANFPASGGYLQKDTLKPDGTVSVRSFTPAQTSGLRTALQALADSIA